MSSTAARRRAIRRIIANEGIGSQSILVGRLAEAGFEVTQATVSRDLKELGAFKARDDGGESVYALPVAGSEGSDSSAEYSLRRLLVDFAETIVPTGNLVLITTPPGAAQVVAGAIDRRGVDGVLGTVAGDDTLLVIVDDRVGGMTVARQLEQIGAGS